jgi:hypothetical protein
MAATPLLERGCLHMVDGLHRRPFWGLKNSIFETLLLCGNRPCVEFLVGRLGLSIWWRMDFCQAIKRRRAIRGRGGDGGRGGVGWGVGWGGVHVRACVRVCVRARAVWLAPCCLTPMCNAQGLLCQLSLWLHWLCINMHPPRTRGRRRFAFQLPLCFCSSASVHTVRTTHAPRYNTSSAQHAASP